MNIFRSPIFRVLLLSMALPAFALLAGCDIDSVDSASAILSNSEGTIFNFSGMYMSPDTVDGTTNGIVPIVYPYTGNHKPSGEIITFLRLLQYGSVLEGYDSAGLTWYGNLGSIQGDTASFTLSGRTTVGSSVEIAGSLSYNSGTAQMDASWIEPTYFGNVFAVATVSPPVTNTPVTDLSISPSSVTPSDTNGISFSASGGIPPYTWSVTDTSYGTVDPAEGNSTKYTPTGKSGVNKVIVTDSAGNPKEATVTYGGSTSLSISPTSLSLSATHTKDKLTASGGAGGYTWEITPTDAGYLSPSSGSEVWYTHTNSTVTSCTITVYDDDAVYISVPVTYTP